MRALQALMKRDPTKDQWRYCVGGNDHIQSEHWEEHDAWRDAVCSLILEEHAHNPQNYQQEWLPFLAKHTAHWQLPLADYHHGYSCSNPKWHERLIDIAPFACFGFHTISNALNGSTFRIPEKCRAQLGSMCENFTHVNFSDHAVFPQGAQSIAACDVFSHFKHMVLAGCFIGDEGIIAIARSPNLSGLEHLDLSKCSTNGHAFIELGTTHNLKSLRSLRLAGVELDPDTLQLLLLPENFSNLRHLDLSNSLLSEESLSKFSWWRSRRQDVRIDL